MPKASPMPEEYEEIELKKSQYVLETRQIEALREAAAERARERRTSRMDASEILREVLDAWIGKGGGRKKR
jgi:uncharacterized membrane protein